MKSVQQTLARLCGTLVLVLMLAGVFAWYFRADLLVDLSTWWAACVRL